MQNKINNIVSKVSSTVGTFKKLARGQAAKAMLASAVAATTLGFASTSAHAAIADVTSIQTTLLPGIGTSVNNVSGYGTTTSGFLSSKSYNMNYAGNDLRVDKISTSTSSYIPAGLANTVVRRFSGPNTDTVWYQGTGGPNSSNINLASNPVGGFEQAFSGNNLLVGSDNLFTNTGNSASNNTNVERLDSIFSTGFKAGSDKVFAIFDRGLSGIHDGFKIAAITALDGTGKPSAYGTLLSVAEGTWGKSDVVGTEHYIVTRRDNNIPGDTFHPSDQLDQPIGGVVIPTNNLAAAGTTIYGYSLFAFDTTGSGSQLVNWTNTTYFPTNTSGVENKGGIDAIGTAAVLYTAIPEPTTVGLVTLTTMAALGYRPRRKA